MICRRSSIRDRLAAGLLAGAMAFLFLPSPAWGDSLALAVASARLTFALLTLEAGTIIAEAAAFRMKAEALTRSCGGV
jgi:hypothetical protein